MLGYNLRDVVSIEVNQLERTLTLHLKFISYQLIIDDNNKLNELIEKLKEFNKLQQEKSKDIDMPDFYQETKSNTP